MTDILVFSPPSPRCIPKNLISAELSDISGWLDKQGYEFDQKSLFVETQYQERYKFQQSNLDTRVLEDKDRLLNYLKSGEDETIERKAAELGDFLSVDMYDIVIVAVPGVSTASRGNLSILMSLPILKESRKKDQTTLIVGPSYIGDKRVAELSYIDYLIEGDFENSLKNVLSHEFDNKPLQDSPGLIYEKDGEIRRFKPYRHPIEQKTKPFFKLDILYKHSQTSSLDIPIIRYQLSQRNLKNEGLEKSDFQYKTIDKVISEIYELQKETGSRYLKFRDRNIFRNIDYVERLATRLIQEDLDISWGARCTVPSRNQEFFDKLASSGCSALHFSIGTMSESLIQRLLRPPAPEIVKTDMDRDQTPGKTKDSIKKAHISGIKPFGYFKIGYIGETWEDYFETINFLRETSYLMGAEVGYFCLTTQDRNKFSQDSRYENICFKHSDATPLENLYRPTVSFKNSNETWEESKRRRKLKNRYMQRKADLELFLKNYGRSYPITFIRKMLRKIYTKDYPDITYSFAS